MSSVSGPAPRAGTAHERVIVAGAGPAGCAAALSLARCGVDTVLLDRARFPRDKVCGDVLLPEARRALDDLGLDVAALAPRAHRIRRCRFHTPDGRDLDLPFVNRRGAAQEWWALPRLELDAWLLAQVEAAGVEVQQETAATEVLVVSGAVRGVRVRRGNATMDLQGLAVVAADGASSSLARSAGLFERPAAHLCLALRAYTAAGAAADDDAFHIFATERTLPGVAWMVPVGGGVANVGVGVLRSQVEGGADLRALLQQAAERHPTLAAALDRCGPLRGWSLPGATTRVQRWRPGLLLAGDAGAGVDPFTGHGIHNALAAGALAAAVLEAALAAGEVGGDALARYDALWRRHFQAEAWAGWALQRLIASPWRVARLARAVEASARLRALTGGLIGHADDRLALLGLARGRGVRDAP